MDNVSEVLQSRVAELTKRDRLAQADKRLDELETRRRHTPFIRPNEFAQAQELGRQNEAAIRRASATPLFDQRNAASETRHSSFTGTLARDMASTSGAALKLHSKRPGALAKYRLGNEAETYSELVFVNNWRNPDRNSGGAWFKTEALIMAKTLNLRTYDPSRAFKLRDMFVQGGELLSGRLSRRSSGRASGITYVQDIHINDFCHSHVTGYGGGKEDVPFGDARAFLAYIGSTQPSSPTAVAGNIAKSTIDARVQGIKSQGGEFNVGTTMRLPCLAESTSWGITLPSANGHAFAVQHRRTEFLGRYQATTFQFGNEAASNLVATAQAPTQKRRKARTFL
jgi:maltoporin